MSWKEQPLSCRVRIVDDIRHAAAKEQFVAAERRVKSFKPESPHHHKALLAEAEKHEKIAAALLEAARALEGASS